MNLSEKKQKQTLVTVRRQGTDSIYLIKYLPLFVGDSQFLRCLDCPSQLARPHLQIWQIVLVDKIFQGVGELR